MADSDGEYMLEDDCDRRATVVDLSPGELSMQKDKLTSITEQFMSLSSVETVEKQTALEIMKLHHNTVVLFRKMEYEKNKEIAALKARIEREVYKQESAVETSQLSSKLDQICSLVESHAAILNQDQKRKKR